MTPPPAIPVYQPSLRGNEKAYVNDCLDSTWISSKGKYVGLFEEGFAQYVGTGHASSVCNGTVAVHLCLLALEIGPGDEVIVPTLTYVASVNPIRYVGATPVFVDSEPDSWQLDPKDVERRITSSTKAIMAVHLYGCPAAMDAIMDIADRHGLKVIEDCAEAIGSRIRDQHVGTFGHIAAFSFFGNKTITTGEGGMVVTSDRELSARVNRLKSQGVSPSKTYWHEMVAYNYRMTNICAAIGLAQLERVDEILSEKLALATYYRERFHGTPFVFHESPRPDHHHSFWMNSVLLPAEVCRDAIMQALTEEGVETRPLFYPVHTMPMYKTENTHPVAEALSTRGINLPSWPGMGRRELAFAADRVVQCSKAAM